MFDLDGTITWHDTLVPYLLFVLRRHPARLRRLWRVPFALVRFAIDRDRGPLKSTLIRAAMAGLTRADVAALTDAFLDAHLAQLCRPQALDRLDAHRRRGDYLVLLSASTDFYVPAIGRRLGFDEAICTGVRWSGDRLDGALSTANRRDAEKTACIDEVRRRLPGLGVSAYGNSTSDFHHLTRVEHPLVVNASRRGRRLAQHLGLPVADWH